MSELWKMRLTLIIGLLFARSLYLGWRKYAEWRRYILCWWTTERKERESFLSFRERKLSFLSWKKKTFYFFLSSFWERKDIFLSLLKLKKSFLSLLSFCRFEKIFLSFLFRNEKVIFLSRGKVFFLAHPWSNNRQSV